MNNYDRWKTSTPEEAGIYGEKVAECNHCGGIIFESDDIVVCGAGVYHELDCWEDAVYELLDAERSTGEELLNELERGRY